MTDLTLFYTFALGCFLVSLFGVALLIKNRKLNNGSDDSDFNNVFIVFFGLVMAFFFLAHPFFTSGGYGLFESDFFSISEIKQLALICIFVTTFLITIFSLVFAPFLFYDNELNFKFSKQLIKA